MNSSSYDNITQKKKNHVCREKKDIRKTLLKTISRQRSKKKVANGYRLPYPSWCWYYVHAAAAAPAVYNSCLYTVSPKAIMGCEIKLKANVALLACYKQKM